MCWLLPCDICVHLGKPTTYFSQCNFHLQRGLCCAVRHDGLVVEENGSLLWTIEIVLRSVTDCGVCVGDELGGEVQERVG